MARASDPIARFARFLAQSEHSPLTIKDYRSDLDAFAAWFEGANGEPMEPAYAHGKTSLATAVALLGWSGSSK